MIRQSFIFLDKISKDKELTLWQKGILDWNVFQNSDEALTKSFDYHKTQIIKAREALLNCDQTFFTKTLKPSEHWRLYDYFKEDIVFLDIETTSFRGNTTIVGLFDGLNTQIFVKNQTLFKKRLQRELDKYKMIITFNGQCFDLPILAREYDINFDNHLHMDLRYVCQKIGLRGGLKRIEEELKITRADEVQGMSGYEAVRLWKKYEKTGDEDYLNLLVKYNEEDIINLKELANYAVPRLWKNLRN
ncbi:ribonuclease H-like domain-containing protein [Candidatus Woesearchaeota archaeon]|nr:ribonuclease H-like domain-containing protein [Candidatus Woesearchaeota archaeon]